MTNGPRRSATLRIFDKAHKEIQALPRDIIGAVDKFQYKFRDNPDRVALERLQGSDAKKGGLYSARITRDYRALLFHLGDNDYLLLSVRPHKTAYQGLDKLANIDKFAVAINCVTGGLDVVDLEAVEKTLDRRGIMVPEITSVSSDAAEPAAGASGKPAVTPLFAAFTAQQLTDLGVTEAALPFVAMITDESQITDIGLLTSQLTFEVLMQLYAGHSYDEVLEFVTRPVAADEPVVADDYQAAAARPATAVITDDAELLDALKGPFTAWKHYLHPTQTKAVVRRYNGPARVSGGPGTGKTIVALHRVKHLAAAIPEDAGQQILLTTFTKNLAIDLRTRLLALGGPELVRTVDIVHIDKLAADVVAGARPTQSIADKAERRKLIRDDEALSLWQEMLTEIGERTWDAEFLADEWAHVIVGQAVNSRTDYFMVRRAGRGRAVSRSDRAEIWRLTELFTKKLDERGVWTFRQVAEQAARIEIERATAGSRPYQRYRHIVVDEAQDLHAAHWKMLRAMVPPGPDDIFITGDAHQRIYGNYVSLGSLGINIRGRSSKLTLSYRTTREILGSAMEVLHGEQYDDLDDGTDDLLGFRSVLRGGRPSARGFATWAVELDGIVEQLKEWSDIAPTSVAVAVPTVAMVAEVVTRLARDGLVGFELDSDGPRVPRGSDGIGLHVGTMHRFKGLEYQRMIVAGVADGLVPRRAIERYGDADPLRYRRERQRDRSLLFVALTRARDTLAVSWHGKPSPFLR